jgi:hypothetical protein
MLKESFIRLSKKHGANPTIPKCYLCGEDKNEIILAGQMKKDMQAPQGMVWDKLPCGTCADYMKQGIIFISVDQDKSTDKDNPYRTGGWAVVKEKVIKEMISDEKLQEQILATRVVFIPDEAWKALGLPPLPDKASHDNPPN